MKDPARPQTLLLRIVHSITHYLSIPSLLESRACFARLPSLTQQACPLTLSGKLVSILMALRLTLLAYHCIAVVDAAVLAVAVAVVDVAAVVVGGVAVAAGRAKGHRQCIE